MLLYILLTIIAVGVLLASRAGQGLLVILITLALLASGICLALVLVYGVILLIQDETAVSYIGTIILSLGVIYVLHEAYKKYQKKELKKSVVGILNEVFPQKETFEENKKATIFIILAYTYLAGMIIYSLIVWIVESITN